LNSVQVIDYDCSTATVKRRLKPQFNMYFGNVASK